MEEIDKAYRIEIDEWHSEILTAHFVGDPAVTIQVVKDFDSIPEFHDVWNNIVLKSSRSTIYQTYEWMYNWWNHLAADNQNTLHILLISHCGKLIGIAPFFIKSYSLAGLKICSQLKLMGGGLNSTASLSSRIELQGVSNYLDIIAADGFEKKTADAIAAYLHEFKYFFDEIGFQNLPEESFIFSRLIPLLKTKNFKISSATTNISAKLNLPESMGVYLKSLETNTRRQYMIMKREKDQGIEIKDVCKKDFASSFQALKHLHQKGINDPVLTSDKRFEKFILKVSEEFFNKGWLRFKVVKLHDKIIAAQLAYKFNNNIYDYMNVSDPKQSASLKPEATLTFMMIEEAISENLGTVDFLRDAGDYKTNFSSSIKNNYRVVVRHSDLHNEIKMKLYLVMKICTQLIFRIKAETAMIKLQMEKHGKLMFLHPYFRFCFHRLKSFAQKQKASVYVSRKIPALKSKNSFALHVGKKSRSHYSPSVERS